jgi:hypothetical protein
MRRERWERWERWVESFSSLGWEHMAERAPASTAAWNGWK